MRKSMTAALAFAALFTIPGLAQAGDTTTGIVGGAVAGAIVGGPVGAVVGGAIGGTVGAASDDNQRREAVERDSPVVDTQSCVRQPDGSRICREVTR
jgi:hypothetical protein